MWRFCNQQKHLSPDQCSTLSTIHRSPGTQIIEDIKGVSQRDINIPYMTGCKPIAAYKKNFFYNFFFLQTMYSARSLGTIGCFRLVSATYRRTSRIGRARISVGGCVECWCTYAMCLASSKSFSLHENSINIY